MYAKFILILVIAVLISLASLTNSAVTNLTANSIDVRLIFPKGYKLNSLGPSKINFYTIEGNSNRVSRGQELIKAENSNFTLNLPANISYNLNLESEVYFCELSGRCFIDKSSRNLIIKKGYKIPEVQIKIDKPA
jgi:hypothetical protein